MHHQKSGNMEKKKVIAGTNNNSPTKSDSPTSTPVPAKYKLIYNYFYSNKRKDQEGLAATFLVLAQNVIPMTPSALKAEAEADGYVSVKYDSDAVMKSVKEDIHNLGERSFFQLVGEAIRLSEYGQETADEVRDLKGLVKVMTYPLFNPSPTKSSHKRTRSSSPQDLPVTKVPKKTSTSSPKKLEAL